MSSDPDFYLASSEGYCLEEPRACWRIKRLRGDQRDDYLLIRVAPPLIGEHYNLPIWEFDVVVVAPRHLGYSLFPITDWPPFVHVAYPRVPDPEARQILHDGELELIAWAELYQTEAAAREKRI